MELNKQTVAKSLAATAGVAYIVCTVFTALFPKAALVFLGGLTHLVNLKEAAVVEVTLGGALLGLILMLFYAYLVGYVFAWTYNRFLKRV